MDKRPSIENQDEGENDLILLELKKSTVCSLVLIIQNSQKQLVKALQDLREMLEKPELRPKHLKDDTVLVEHINLHLLLVEDSELILGECEQGIVEQEAERKAEVAKPFWQKIQP